MEETIKTVEGAVATFNEYLRTRSELSRKNGDQDQEDGSAFARPDEREGQLSIDIEAIQNYAGTLAGAIAGEWAREAEEKASIDSLEKTGDHADYVVQSLKRKLGMKP